MTTEANNPTWTRSTRCGTSGCVEIARTADAVLIRDSKNPDGPVLTFTADEWQTFVEGTCAGEFDGPESAAEAFPGSAGMPDHDETVEELYDRLGPGGSTTIAGVLVIREGNKEAP